MKKKFITGLLAATMFVSPFIAPVTASASKLEEMREEKERLENENKNIEDNINVKEETLQSLAEEKADLEETVVQLQKEIDQTVRELQKQDEKLAAAEEKVVQLQKEIEQLKELIEKRKGKIANQARAVQTDGNTANLLDIVISAESLSDLIGRVSLVNQLVDANQEIVAAQIEDQKTLESKEAEARAEKEAIEVIKAEIDANRDNLVAQKDELDKAIIAVATHYDMTEEEKNAFVEEQQIIAEKTSTLSAEMQAEQERIIAEQKAKQEAERKAREERERQAAEAAEAAAKEAAAKEAAAKDAAAKEAAAKDAAAKEAAAKDAAAKEAAAKDAAAQEAAAEAAAKETAAKAAAQEAASQKAASKKAASTKKASTSNNSSNNSNKSSKSSSASSSSSSSSSTKSSSGFIRPSGGYTTSPFGYRIHPISGRSKLHAGMDFGGGGPIIAAQGGTVTAAQYHSSWGYYVKIDHGNGLSTLYAHMVQGSLRVSAGQKVSQGQQLGTMGTTGSSTGVHLHFEIYKNGTRVNPAPYLGM